MAPAQSIERPSKGSRNSQSLKEELFFSNLYHSEGLPLLVSPALLRERGLGQIDLARLRKFSSTWKIELAEVKSSKLGEEVYSRLQKYRIQSSLHFLVGILGFLGSVCVLRRKLSETL